MTTTPQKDVIYIDVEDDITAIIGKVKVADHKIVAIVPPKRIGAIQSAVNLKLVQRAAKSAGKHLVIITNNAALMALAGSADIPVARNLQSKPELAEIPALEIDEGEDVIDGSEVPAKAAKAEKIVPAEKTPESDSEPDIEETDDSAASTDEAKPKDRLPKDKAKIPNFDTFRKKLFLIIAGVLALAGFLVWALVFAPRANVIITASTTDTPLSSQVALGDELTTSLKDGNIRTVTKTQKEPVSIDFIATGEKDVGEKATGTVKVDPIDSVIALKIIEEGQAVVPAGTIITSASGAAYVTNQALVYTQANWQSTKNGQNVGVTARANGESYNGATGVASGPNGYNIQFVGATSGGTSKVITVVTEDDVAKASESMSSTGKADSVKQELITAFGDDHVVLGDSFKQDTAGVKPLPAVDAEAAGGKAALTGEIVYTLTAIPKTELKKYLDTYFAQQIDGMNDQKVYSSGVDGVEFTNLARNDKTFTASIAATGKIGPKIDADAVREFVRGKRFGEIQSYIQEIDGVRNVDVKFSPFWVSSAPNDVSKIRVEFKVDGK